MRILTILSVFILVLKSLEARAHEAEEASVGLTLRDQAVEVRLNIDIENWLEGITGLPRSMEHPSTLEPLLLLAQHNLKEMRLTVGGTPVDLALVQFPAAEDILHAAADHGHEGHARTTIMLQGDLTTPARGEVALSVPKAMGPVIMSYYQPKTLWVPAAATGHFKVESAQAAPGNSGPRPLGIWLAGLAFATLSLGLFGVRICRKSQAAA